MIFRDRTEAGQKLARALEKYQGHHVLVLAIPRGGVEVGFQVANHLGAEFSIVVSRKLPFPDNPEAGFGAVTEDGSTYLIPEATQYLSHRAIRDIVRDQEQEILRRIMVLRNREPLPVVVDRTVILVDDGIAMGSTMRASISLCKKKKAQKIIVAAPVSGVHTAKEIARLVDEVFILTQPAFFRAVAQAYQNWYDVSDDEVIAILNEWRQQH